MRPYAGGKADRLPVEVQEALWFMSGSDGDDIVECLLPELLKDVTEEEVRQLSMDLNIGPFTVRAVCNALLKGRRA